MLNDIIKKYHYTYTVLEYSPNPKVQLAAIVDFFKFCEESGHSHLSITFIGEFLHFLINIFKNSSVDFIDPYYFNASKFLLKKALQLQKDNIIIDEINSVLDLINIRLLLLYYYIGEAENGIVVLKDILSSKSVKESGVSLNHYERTAKKSTSTTTALVDPRMFNVNKAFDILRQINYEISRINSFSNKEVNILLVESDNSGQSFRNFGLVQGLECTVKHQSTSGINNPVIENIVDIHEEGINSIRNDLLYTSNSILERFGGHLNPLKWIVNLRFKDLSGIYKGTSFGGGASVLIPAVHLSSSNSRTQYSISGMTAFTGSMDNRGNLTKLPEQSIETKIEAAFFSWIKYVVIPQENLPDAKLKVSNLHKTYPRKDLNIIGVKCIDEVIDNPDIVKIEKETLYHHSKKTIKRHPVPSYTLLSLVLILLTTYSVWKFVPRNFKSLPQTTKNWMSMIYCPDRDSVWKWQSTSHITGDTIFFGDVAIGDMICQRIELWNNGEKKQPIRIELGGENKDEFEVLWGVDVLQKETPDFVYPDLIQRIFIKFVPWKSLGEKKAKLIFYSNEDPKNNKIIYLKGNTDYFKNGYSLKLKKDDIFYVNPKRGNILGHDFTISFWFKTNKVYLGVFNDNNTTYSLTKFSIFLSRDTTLHLEIMKPKDNPNNNYAIHIKKPIKLNDWNFVSISHKNNLTYFIVNEDINYLITKDEHFQQMEDMFFFGAHDPNEPESIGFRNDDWYLNVTDFRIYEKSLTTNEIFRNKFNGEDYKNKDLMVYYDFEETQGDKVFDKSKSNIDGEFKGMPCKTLDMPLIKSISPKTSDNPGDSYVKIKDKGEVRLNKDVFQGQSSFTIQFEAKTDGNIRQDGRSYFIISGLVYNYNWGISGKGSIFIEHADALHDNSSEFQIKYNLDSSWHRYTWDYNLEKNTGRFFVDGNFLQEYSFGKFSYDITRQQFFILFGKGGQYLNPRFRCEETSIDNIAFFNRTLNYVEIKQSSPEEIKKIPGIIALWSFEQIDGHVCFDEINHIPIFLWDEFEVKRR